MRDTPRVQIPVAAEQPPQNNHISTVDGMPVVATAEELEAMRAQLVFAARELAVRGVRVGPDADPECHDDAYRCRECDFSSAYLTRIPHAPECATGRVLGLVYAILRVPTSNRKEDAHSGEAACADAATPSRDASRVESNPAGSNLVRWDMSAEEAERLNLCYQFCEGIAAEDLQRELPLASPLRRRWSEIQYLHRVLPFLPAVQL